MSESGRSDRPERAAAALRLNRFLALVGLGSRRAVESLITAGRVSVDGEVATDLGRRIDPARQRVEVDGELVELPADRRVYVFHKPRGVVSTLRPQAGQRGLAEFRAAAGLPERMMPVGRLDADTRGLLLWTDVGDLSQALMRPGTGVWKCYTVTCQKPLSREAHRLFMRGGLEMDGRPLHPCHLEPARTDGRHWILELREGRNRQIRRMFAAVGNRVTDLVRVAVGPIELGRLRQGDFRRLNRREEKDLRSAAGLRKPAGSSPAARMSGSKNEPTKRTGRAKR